MMGYCYSPFLFQRRKTREITVGDPANGGVIIGGDRPIVRQSMITCDTMDTAACVRQTLDLVAVGCEIVRITAPTVSDAANLKNIVAELRARGCKVPIVADIHFKPEAAFEAAKWVEMIRINPGNYADKKKFVVHEYNDAEYAAELCRVEEQFAPLLKLCKDLSRAMRIGANHGSLSDRIMNRWGDTPEGMVQSVLEFARIARKHEFHNFKFSLKSSNPKVMIECYRLLVARCNELGPDWNYPIHLGVTEAGEGEDGRIKSAIGIGSLLCDGIGDTIRVSLTEDSPREIEVCDDLIAQVSTVVLSPFDCPQALQPRLQAACPFDPFTFRRRSTTEILLNGGAQCGALETVRVITPRAAWERIAPQLRPGDDVRPEAIYEDLQALEIDPTQPFELHSDTQLVTVADGTPLPPIAAFRLLASQLTAQARKNPILIKDTLLRSSRREEAKSESSSRRQEAKSESSSRRQEALTKSESSSRRQEALTKSEVTEEALPSKIALLRSSMIIGSLLADGIGDAILLREESDPIQALRLAYNILQAIGCRSFKTDYVACPSCGRTLFNLQTITARIKARTQHLKGVKIAIMGCIVNGPGEMADADFGYVGGAPGKINLYVGKKPVKFNIPEAEAVDRLVDLIREQGKWSEPS